MTGKLSISVILLSYNHEAFVAEALRSWLDQDYPDFELVIADDASTDRTREVIAAELTKSRSASVRIVERHQAKNIGLLANINSAMSACSGDIIVTAAGDDIAESLRLRYAVEIFEADPTVFAAVTNFIKIDETGLQLDSPAVSLKSGRYSYDQNDTDIYAGSPIFGAMASYRAELFRVFGPMQPGTHGEDNCYWVRALLCGAIYYDSRPMVRWRQHRANIFNHLNDGFVTDESRQRFLRLLRAHELMAPQWERDIALAINRGLICSKRGAKIAKVVQKECGRHALHRCSLGAVSWAQWIRVAWRFLRVGRRSYVWKMFRLRLMPWKRAHAWRRLAKERA
jgi:glycosyltransferase involved in cell wall biosynthesis